MDRKSERIAELDRPFLRTYFHLLGGLRGRLSLGPQALPLEYLYTPFLVWAAFRFGRRYAVTATCVLAAIATWGTAHGFGPFSRESLDASLLLLQAFIAIMAITTLALAAEVTEHRRADERVRQLAVTDPMTGLANYRRLLDALDLEIKRSERTSRSFSILLLDWTA